MLQLNLDSRNLDSLGKKLISLGNGIFIVNSQEIVQVGRDWITQAMIYPSEHAGNRLPAPYWSRGIGKIGAGGNILRPSENLRGNWRMVTINTGNGVEVRITNATSYGAWVHDNNLQAQAMARHGWLTIDQIADKVNLSPAKINTPTSVGGRVLNKVQNLFGRIFG